MQGLCTHQHIGSSRLYLKQITTFPQMSHHFPSNESPVNVRKGRGQALRTLHSVIYLRYSSDSFEVFR